MRNRKICQIEKNLRNRVKLSKTLYKPKSDCLLVTLALALSPMQMEKIMGNYAQNVLFQVPAEANELNEATNVQDYLRNLMQAG